MAFGPNISVKPSKRVTIEAGDSSFDIMAKKRGYVKPESVYRLPARRKFEAARVSRLTDDAPISTVHINAEIRDQGKILVARARWLHQNDGYIRRGLNIIANNVIGAQGIQLHPLIPGPNGNAIDPKINEAVLSGWLTWGKRGVFNASNRYSWRAFQKFCLTNKFRDGEAFILQTTGAPTASNPFGYWLTFIDPLRVPYDLNKIAANGNRIVCGIELSADDIPTAYYVQTNERDPLLTESYNGRHYVRVDAARVIHDFDPEFPEQVRGFSGMVGAMRVAPMLDGYNEAALVAARNGASTMGWYLEDGEASESYDGEDEDEETGEFYDDIEPGTMRKLPRGIKAEMHNPAWPNTSHSDFVKSVLRHIASDLGVSYHSIANDLEGINLSSIRHGVQEDREQYKQHQEDQIETVHEPIYKAWLLSALGFGLIQVGQNPVNLNTSNYKRLCKVKHRPRGWEFAEPLKDGQANALGLKLRTTSISEIIRKTGRDPETVFAELADDIKKLEALGLDFSVEDLAVTIETGDDEQTTQQGGNTNA